MIVHIFKIIYKRMGKQQLQPCPVVGEEDDLGVLEFLAIYFVLTYCLCKMCMYPKHTR